jgi:hypothetical protein
MRSHWLFLVICFAFATTACSEATSPEKPVVIDTTGEQPSEHADEQPAETDTVPNPMVTPAPVEPTEPPPTPEFAPGLFAFGGEGSEQGEALAVDDEGNIFVVGVFSDTISLGGLEHASNGSHDIFAAKISPDLEVEWVQTFGSRETDYLQKITVGPSGELYVASSFDGVIDVGGSTYVGQGDLDGLLVRLDGATGAFDWSLSFGADRYDGLRDLTFWGEELLVAGYVNGAVQLGGLELTTEKSTTFIATIDAETGDYLRAQPVAEGSRSQPNAIKVDSVHERILITGTFVGDMHVNDAYTLTGQDSNDVYVVALNRNFAPLWAVGYTGHSSDTPWDLTIDVEGNTYVGGSYVAYIGLDGQYLETGVIGYESDAFVFKIDPNGQTLWGTALGDGASHDHVDRLHVLPSGELLASGRLAGGWLTTLNAQTGDPGLPRSYDAPGYAAAQDVVITDERILTVGVFEETIHVDGTTVPSAGRYDVFLHVSAM